MADRSPLLQIIRPSQLARGEPSGVDRHTPPVDSSERCDVCGVAIAAAHDHVVDLNQRSILCACRACYLLFTHDGAGGGRLRAIPQRYVHLSGLAAAREQIESLGLPIGLAFFLRSSATGRVTAFYPSPAGATESELPMDAWDELVASVPPLGSVAADVEAVLVRRSEGTVDAFIVPIDASYELVGRIRRAWRGFQGGEDVWREIDAFFERTAERAQTAAGV